MNKEVELLIKSLRLTLDRLEKENIELKMQNVSLIKEVTELSCHLDKIYE